MAGKKVQAKKEKELVQEGNTVKVQEGTVQEGKVNQDKETKRTLSWQELVMARAKAIPLTRQGTEYNLSRESLLLGLKREGKTMAQKWNFLTLGYHINLEGKPMEDKDSHFQRITGRPWKQVEMANSGSTKGRVITLSSGSGLNHFLVILPLNKPITVKLVNGGTVTITKDNFLEHYQGFTNHGRAYRVAQFLAFQYGLEYYGLPRNGKGYGRSNSTNWNFNFRDGHWEILTIHGNYRKLPDGWNPLDILEDMAKGGDKWKVING